MEEIDGVRGFSVKPSTDMNPTMDNYKDFIPSRERVDARMGKPVPVPAPGLPGEVAVVLPGERDFVDASAMAKLKAKAMQDGKTRDQERREETAQIAERKKAAREVVAQGSKATAVDLKYAKSTLEGSDGENIDHMIERLRRDWK